MQTLFACYRNRVTIFLLLFRFLFCLEKYGREMIEIHKKCPRAAHALHLSWVHGTWYLEILNMVSIVEIFHPCSASIFMAV